MLLRRVIENVKDQNWFAIGIDFVIVVVGVFIGIQVSNWNDARADKAQEVAILAQLESEFSEIQGALEKQIVIRKLYVSTIGELVASLEGTGPVPSDEGIKRALIAARATGRRPAQSAAYLQLTANGELARLSNDTLKQALIQYHTRLERDAFIFPELMRLVIEELSSNTAVDYDVNAAGFGGAAIDEDRDADDFRTTNIRSYDLDTLREYEERYETIHRLHGALVQTDQIQLELAHEILRQISEERP
jgi:hypothetical protein